MAESLAKGWRPLEPDAGNAAEGSEGRTLDGILAMRKTAWLFDFMNVVPNEMRDLLTH